MSSEATYGHNLKHKDKAPISHSGREGIHLMKPLLFKHSIQHETTTLNCLR
jgi:hypothetical protein